MFAFKKDQDSGSDELLALKAELAKTTAELSRIKEEKELITLSQKLGMENRAMELFSSGVSLKDTVFSLLSEFKAEDISQDVQEFLNSSSNPIGVSGSKDEEDLKVKTFSEAVLLISDRDKCSKAEAADKAKIEFKSLFEKMYK